MKEVGRRVERIVDFVSTKSEVKDFLWYSSILLINGVFYHTLNSVKSGRISQAFGISELNIYFMVSNLFFIFCGIAGFFGSGMCSILSSDLAKNDISQIGKKINVNIPINIIFTGVFALLLWLLRDTFLNLYSIPDNDKEPTRAFYNLYLTLVPVLIFGANISFVVLAFHSLFLRMIFEVSAFSIELVTLLLFIDYGYGIESVVYAQYFRWIIILVMIVWIYNPNHITHYRLFTREMWKFQSNETLKLFFTDSIYMLLRGIFLMGQFFVNPFVISHLGSYPLAAYTFMNSLFFYADMVGDVIGAACILKGSHYICLKVYSLFRKMLKVVYLVGVGLSFLFLIVFLFGKDLIFQLFTSENRVLMEIDESYPYYLFLMFLGPITGIVEGFMLSRQYFLELFVISFVGITMWASIIAINFVLIQSLSLIFIAHSVLLWTRLLGSSLIIAISTYQEWLLPDQYPDTIDTEIELKKEEKIPLLK